MAVQQVNQPSQKSLPTFSDRAQLMKQLITVAFRLGGRTLLTGAELDLEVKVWEYALGDVPTHHLEECFRRAVRAKENGYMVLATEINQQYREMLPELQRQAQAHSAQTDYLLQSGQGGLGYISLAEFRARHNLPASWKPGDPYPPESDLYDAAVPPQPEQVIGCWTCRDARLIKDYPPGPNGRLYPYIKPCPDCG
jgi:hypothetical protein